VTPPIVAVASMNTAAVVRVSARRPLKIDSSIHSPDCRSVLATSAAGLSALAIAVRDRIHEEAETAL
jgi:hypothetical protein